MREPHLVSMAWIPGVFLTLLTAVLGLSSAACSDGTGKTAKPNGSGGTASGTGGGAGGLPQDTGGTSSGGSIGGTNSGSPGGSGVAGKTGGTAGSGGESAVSSLASSGGTSGAGGTVTSGGTSGGTSSGGMSGRGGAVNSGGTSGSAGTAAPGGTSGLGGTASSGSTGGSGAAGRTGGTGGAPGTGGNAGSCPVELVGWATVDGGTQGGGAATPQRVTSIADLRTLAGDGTARVIEISGTITTGTTPLEIKSNKTLVGVDKNATIKGGVNMGDGTSNVIIRNLNILGVGTSSNSGEPVDTVAARGSHNLWFDHLNLTDGPDGMLDLTKGSDHATVSWCKVSYATSNRDHRLSLLFGAGSTEGATDTGKNNHTIHHNWFAQNVDQRMPRVLFGKSHAFNNYYNSPGNSYCVGSGSFASVLVENNYFKDVKSPHQFADTNHAYIAATGNVYDNTTGNKETGLGGTDGASVGPWTPSYPYTLDKAADVPSIVQRCAGPQ
jgi:pectate lyase